MQTSPSIDHNRRFLAAKATALSWAESVRSENSYLARKMGKEMNNPYRRRSSLRRNTKVHILHRTVPGGPEITRRPKDRPGERVSLKPSEAARSLKMLPIGLSPNVLSTLEALFAAVDRWPFRSSFVRTSFAPSYAIVKLAMGRPVWYQPVSQLARPWTAHLPSGQIRIPLPLLPGAFL